MEQRKPDTADREQEMRDAGFLHTDAQWDMVDRTMWDFVKSVGQDNVEEHYYNSGIWSITLTNGVTVTFQDSGS